MAGCSDTTVVARALEDPASDDGENHPCIRLENQVDILAHELKQPLLCILVLSERLEHMIAQLDPQKVTKHPIMKRDVAALLQSVQQMRDLLTARNAFGTIGFVDTDWRQQIEHGCEALVALASSRNVTLKTSLLAQAEHGPDPKVVLQIMGNLVNNACEVLEKSTKAEKEILIETLEQEEILIVRVHDSGTGVPAEEREHIFEKGFTSKKSFAGNGIGLWVCRKLAHSFQGSLETIASDQLSGACFVLTLPQNSSEKQLGVIA